MKQYLCFHRPRAGERLNCRWRAERPIRSTSETLVGLGSVENNSLEIGMAIRESLMAGRH